MHRRDAVVLNSESGLPADSEAVASSQCTIAWALWSTGAWRHAGTSRADRRSTERQGGQRPRRWTTHVSPALRPTRSLSLDWTRTVRLTRKLAVSICQCNVQRGCAGSSARVRREYPLIHGSTARVCTVVFTGIALSSARPHSAPQERACKPDPADPRRTGGRSDRCETPPSCLAVGVSDGDPGALAGAALPPTASGTAASAGCPGWPDRESPMTPRSGFRMRDPPAATRHLFQLDLGHLARSRANRCHQPGRNVGDQTHGRLPGLYLRVR